MDTKARRNVILFIALICSLGLIGYITKSIDEYHFSKMYERPKGL